MRGRGSTSQRIVYHNIPKMMKSLRSLLAIALTALSVANADTLDYYFVDDLLEDHQVNHTWMEIGYVNLTDTEWTTVTTTVLDLNPLDARQMSVFLSLPEYGGPTVKDGWPMVAKLNGRAQRQSDGAYSFEARLVQPNDSYCPQIWWIPFNSPVINVGWLIVEEGAYNVTSSQLFFGSGEITRDNSVPLLSDDVPALYHAKFVMNYTTGCDAMDPDAVCTFPEKQNEFDNITVTYGDVTATYEATGWSHLGSSNQLQTSNNKVDDGKEMWMNIRVRHVFLDRIVMMLAVHSVYVNNSQSGVHQAGPENYTFPIYPDYADIHTPEVASYFVWETNLRLTCVEGLVMETSIQFPITDHALQMDYFYKYDKVPGLFGVIGTLNSVADTVSLRVFNRSITGSHFITQEDQCTDKEQAHGTAEKSFSMVVGKGQNIIGNTRCFIAYDVQPCTYTMYLYDLFMDGWDNVELVVDVGSEVLHFSTSCGSKKITFESASCKWNAHMQTTDGKQPITWWENYWSWEYKETVYIGDYDSTISVDHEYVEFTDLANYRLDAKENKCEQCKVAPPPPGPKKGKGNDGKGNGNSDNGGVAYLTAGKIAPSPPDGVAVAPADGAPAGVLQILSVEGPMDDSSPSTFTIYYALNVVDLTSAVDSAAFYRGAVGVTGPSIHSIDVTGFTTSFYVEGSFVVPEDDIIDFIKGNIYIQVNTANWLTGEIRAQALLPNDWVGYYLTYISDDASLVDLVGDGYGKISTDDGSGKGLDDGSGKGHDDGSGKGAAHGKPPPVPVLIELFDDDGKGWYNNSGTWSYPPQVEPDDRRRLHPHHHIDIPPRQTITLDYDVAVFPDILMYPTYVIMTVDKTKQLHVGSLCPHREIERCEERLPPHGEFVFRVMGKDPENDDHWNFCGVHGHIGQELQFEMKKGKCVPISLTNAYTFCSYTTKVTLSGVMTLAGVSSDLSEADSRVLENEISSMLVSTTSIAITSWNVNAEGSTEVSFEATILAEKQGVDGRFRENVDNLVSVLKTNMQTAFSSGAFLSQMETALAEYPSNLVSVTKTSAASLDSLEVLDIEYVEASTYVSERTPSALPEAQATSFSDATDTQKEDSSVVAAVCAVVGVIVVVAAVALRSRQRGDNYVHQELATDSEHADSIPEFDLGLEPANPKKGMFFVSKERF